jgi:hypothetical protein
LEKVHFFLDFLCRNVENVQYRQLLDLAYGEKSNKFKRLSLFENKKANIFCNIKIQENPMKRLSGAEMQLEDRLTEFWGSEDQPLPWPVGLDEGKASQRALAAAKILGREELLAVSKFNPFREDRDKAIRKLRRRRRLPIWVLGELSGFCRGTVSRILRGKS